MRTLLVLALVYGMAPALGEIVESAVHYAVEGHLSHTDADHGDLGDQGCEHGCGTAEHHCQCCPSQVLAPPASSGVAMCQPGIGHAPVSSDALLSAHDPSPPYRPPITT